MPYTGFAKTETTGVLWNLLGITGLNYSKCCIFSHHDTTIVFQVTQNIKEDGYSRLIKNPYSYSALQTL